MRNTSSLRLAVHFLFEAAGLFEQRKLGIGVFPGVEEPIELRPGFGLIAFCEVDPRDIVVSRDPILLRLPAERRIHLSEEKFIPSDGLLGIARGFVGTRQSLHALWRALGLVCKRKQLDGMFLVAARKFYFCLKRLQVAGMFRILGIRGGADFFRDLRCFRDVARPRIL